MQKVIGRTSLEFYLLTASGICLFPDFISIEHNIASVLRVYIDQNLTKQVCIILKQRTQLFSILIWLATLSQTDGFSFSLMLAWRLSFKLQARNLVFNKEEQPQSSWKEHCQAFLTIGISKNRLRRWHLLENCQRDVGFPGCFWIQYQIFYRGQLMTQGPIEEV